MAGGDGTIMIFGFHCSWSILLTFTDLMAVVVRERFIVHGGCVPPYEKSRRRVETATARRTRDHQKVTAMVTELRLTAGTLFRKDQPVTVRNVPAPLSASLRCAPGRISRAS